MSQDPVRLIRQEEIVDLTRQLVRIPSQFIEDELAQHDEIAQFLARYLQDIGLEVEVVEAVKGFPVVVGSTPEVESGPTIGVIGHYSTVAIGNPAEWTRDPLGGELVDGRIYGRGANDQKGGIAAFLVATKCLLASGLPLKRRLRLLLVPGEGCTEMAMRPIGRDNPEAVRCDVYLDSDGGPGNISLMHGGFVWLELTTKGKGGHSGALTADRTVPINPIQKLVNVLYRLQNPDWMTYERHPLFTPEYGRYTEDGIVDINIVHGGSKVNIIPNEARAQVDIRMLPSQTSDVVLQELDAVLDDLRERDPDLDVSYRVLAISQNRRETSPDHFMIKAIRETARELGQPEPHLVGSIGGGRATLSQFGPVLHFGAGSGKGAHAPDEYATADGLETGAKLYARLYTKVLT